MRRSPHAATPLAPDDAARLHMSVETNPMLITVLLRLERAITAREMEDRLAERIVRYARFRRRVEEPLLGLGMPHWSDDPDFDVRNHVHRIDPAAFPSADRPTLPEIVSDLASLPLGRDRPLWRAHVIDGVEPGIVMIVHHALADGAALLGLLAELADDATPTLVEPTTPEARTTRDRLLQLARGAAAAGQLAMSPTEPETSIKRARLVGRRHLAFSRALSLERLREGAHANETTITGLLLAAVAGACRAEIHPSADDAKLTLHALVPVDARPHAPEGGRVTLGNRYGSVLVRLPVGLGDRSERIRFVRRETRGLRTGALGSGVAGMASAAGALSPFVERIGVEVFSRKASVVVSSVRGPERKLRLCGAAIEDVVVWAPAAGSIGVSITLMSYGGHARVGVAVDEGISDDPHRLVRAIEDELDPL